MITRSLIELVFSAASMERWNDHPRPAVFTELGKQAHKMIMAWVIARYESETRGVAVDWTALIEGGIFEFLHRVVLTDIKPPVFHKLMQNEEQPVVWRGPIVAGVVKQFWTDVKWGDVDYMFVDMPPGTGDVPLTVFQSLPVDGIIIVTTPQDLVSMIVKKAVNMAKDMQIPILGIVENMSYVPCPHCGEKVYMFGESHADEVAKAENTVLIDSLPIDPKMAQAMDGGTMEFYETQALEKLSEVLPKLD